MQNFLIYKAFFGKIPPPPPLNTSLEYNMEKGTPTPKMLHFLVERKYEKNYSGGGKGEVFFRKRLYILKSFAPKFNFIRKSTLQLSLSEKINVMVLTKKVNHAH